MTRRSGCGGDGGGPELPEVGQAFAKARSTAGDWWRHYRRESRHAARPTGGDRRSKLWEQAGWVAERLAYSPELTLGEVGSDLAGRGVEASHASV